VRLLDEVRDIGCPLVVLTGGDPAKRPDLVDLVRHGTRIGLRMALTPSATPLVTPRLLGQLADAGLARLAVSLDGAAAASHDGFRGVAGSFARTLGILRDARAAGLTTQVNTTVTDLNVGELEAIADLLRAGTVLEMLRTPLLSLAGKARAGLEPLLPRTRSAGDESVRAFIGRRFGPELAQALIEPLIGGIYGGDTSRLSAEACVPRLRAFEREHGSVTRGLRRAVRDARRRTRSGEQVLPPIVSLQGGMASLPDRLARGLGERVVRGVAATCISRLPARRFRVDTSRGQVACEGVVLATPAWQAPALVEAFAPDLAAGLAGIAHTALDIVTFAWPRHEVPHALDGTGWVRAPDDRRPTLACTWSSRKWPGRAPDGFVLLRSVLVHSGASEPKLVVAARADLRDLLGVEAAPRLVRVRRRERATPIYETGHHDRMARLTAADLGAFAIAGNALGGVGVPDCFASGEAAARAVLAAVHGLRSAAAGTGPIWCGAGKRSRETGTPAHGRPR